LIKTIDVSPSNPLTSEKYQLKYHVLNNKACLQRTLQGQYNDSDLVSGVYEGGLKLWECSIDLAKHIVLSQENFKSKRVLELGCGQGLPGIAALKYGQGSQVVFQDYNEEVVENATKRCVKTNIESD
jgi:predicted nicotinamide N-methyase